MQIILFMKKIYLVILLITQLMVYAQDFKPVMNDSVIALPTIQASPKEGMDGFQKFFIDNIQIPDIYFESGEIYIRFRFIVEKDGKLSDIEVINDTYYLSNEIKRVLMLAPYWNPSYLNGVPVRSKFTLPITIKTNTKNQLKISKKKLSEFTEKYISKLSLNEIDNQYIRFTCDCILLKVDENEDKSIKVYEYDAKDKYIFYKVEVLNKDVLTNKTIESLTQNFIKTQKNATHKDVMINNNKVRVIKYEQKIRNTNYYNYSLLYEGTNGLIVFSFSSPSIDRLEIVYYQLLKDLYFK